MTPTAVWLSSSCTEELHQYSRRRLSSVKKDTRHELKPETLELKQPRCFRLTALSADVGLGYAGGHILKSLSSQDLTMEVWQTSRVRFRLLLSSVWRLSGEKSLAGRAKLLSGRCAVAPCIWQAERLKNTQKNPSQQQTEGEEGEKTDGAERNNCGTRTEIIKGPDDTKRRGNV